MIAMVAGAMHMTEAIARFAAEMMALIAVPDPVAAGVPEEAVIAPIAVIEGPVIAIVITVINIAATGGDTGAGMFACFAARQ